MINWFKNLFKSKERIAYERKQAEEKDRARIQELNNQFLKISQSVKRTIKKRKSNSKLVKEKNEHLRRLHTGNSNYSTYGTNSHDDDDDSSYDSGSGSDD